MAFQKSGTDQTDRDYGECQPAPSNLRLKARKPMQAMPEHNQMNQSAPIGHNNKGKP